MTTLALIVGYARNRVIGRDGKLPWRYPEDLQHFKRVTMGHALIMGSVTYESIGRPLPGRRNLVLCDVPGYEAPGCEVFDSFEGALAAARETDDCPFVIGGASVYAQALPCATHLYVTEIQQDVEGDAYFPVVDEDEWVETERRTGAGGRLVFRVLQRR